MPTLSRSAKLYQERRQPELRSTFRGPGPQVNLEANEARTRALAPPLPLPSLLADQNGAPPPDAGRTHVWPHGLLPAQ